MLLSLRIVREGGPGVSLVLLFFCAILNLTVPAQGASANVCRVRGQIWVLCPRPFLIELAFGIRTWRFVRMVALNRGLLLRREASGIPYEAPCLPGDGTALPLRQLRNVQWVFLALSPRQYPSSLPGVHGSTGNNSTDQ
jgi:hypothetical protein